MALHDDSDDDQEMHGNGAIVDQTQNRADFERNLKQCRDALSQYPTDYTAHLNYVQCLSSSIEHFTQFKRAWTKMRVRFAIPPSVSLQLINSEINGLRALCDGTPSKEQILEIVSSFKSAVSDYTMSIELWTEYLHFVFANKSVIGMPFIRREVLQDAVRSIGQHFVNGNTVCFAVSDSLCLFTPFL